MEFDVVHAAKLLFHHGSKKLKVTALSIEARTVLESTFLTAALN
jgi:hypothetical protein